MLNSSQIPMFSTNKKELFLDFFKGITLIQRLYIKTFDRTELVQTSSMNDLSEIRPR